MPSKKNDDVAVNPNTGELVGIEALEGAAFNATQLNSLDTSQEALLALVEEWGLSSDDLIIGDAFPLPNPEDPGDKDALIGVPMIFVQWKFGTSNNTGADYVQIKAVRTDTQAKVGIFDSGLGIYGALDELSGDRVRFNLDHAAEIAAGKIKPKRAYNGAVIPNGLTKSEYPPKYDGDVMVRPAGKTYYIA